MNIVKLIFFFFVIKNTNGVRLIYKYLSIVKDQADSIIAKAGTNTECGQHLKIMLTDLLHGKKWAWEMIDASAKIQPGILAGNLYQVGNYDQCLNVRMDSTSSEIRGQYCTVLLLPSANFSNEFSFLLDTRLLTDWTGVRKTYQLSDILGVIKFTYGICIPSSCSIGHLQKIWDYLEHAFGLSVHVMFYDVMCSHAGKIVEPYGVDKYVFVFFGTIAVIVLLSTAYDLLVEQQKMSKVKKHEDSSLVAFSLYTNLKRLFSMDVDEKLEGGKLSCVNGIKVFSMLWVLQGHRFLVNIFQANVNAFYVFEWRKQVENVIIIGSSFSVDTFFAVSGLLLTFVFFKNKVTSRKKPSILHFYAYRFIRLTPALLATILFYMSVLKYLNDGPVWHLIIKKISGSCLYNWWSTLFFVSNLVDLTDQCLEHSWFLAVDSQLYFIAPIILYNLLKHPIKTTLAASCVGLASIIYAFFITINNNYGSIYFDGNIDFFKYIYQSTFIRMPPWLIGVLFGYLIFKYPSVRIPKALNFLLWNFSLGSMGLILWSHVLFTRNDYNALRSAIFNAITRPLWGLSVSLIIFSCATGNGGIVNRILSLSIFNVLVRLSYSMYLVHLGVLLYLAGRKRTFDHFSNIWSYHDFWGDLAFTLVPATIMYVVFEAPFVKIGRIMYKKRLEKARLLMSKSTKRCSSDMPGMAKKSYVICVYSYDDIKQRSKKKRMKTVQKKNN